MAGAIVSSPCLKVLEVNLFGNRQGVINLDAKIANGAFELCVTKQNLNGAQISCLPVNQGRLGSAQGMGSAGREIETDGAWPR
jgi:hypothetical protein